MAVRIRICNKEQKTNLVALLLLVPIFSFLFIIITALLLAFSFVRLAFLFPGLSFLLYNWLSFKLCFCFEVRDDAVGVFI